MDENDKTKLTFSVLLIHVGDCHFDLIGAERMILTTVSSLTFMRHISKMCFSIKAASFPVVKS